MMLVEYYNLQFCPNGIRLKGILVFIQGLRKKDLLYEWEVFCHLRLCCETPTDESAPKYKGEIRGLFYRRKITPN